VLLSGELGRIHRPLVFNNPPAKRAVPRMPGLQQKLPLQGDDRLRWERDHQPVCLADILLNYMGRSNHPCHKSLSNKLYPLISFSPVDVSKMAVWDFFLLLLKK
jgi:hypothetical protein